MRVRSASCSVVAALKVIAAKQPNIQAAVMSEQSGNQLVQLEWFICI